ANGPVLDRGCRRESIEARQYDRARVVERLVTRIQATNPASARSTRAAKVSAGGSIAPDRIEARPREDSSVFSLETLRRLAGAEHRPSTSRRLATPVGDASSSGQIDLDV